MKVYFVKGLINIVLNNCGIFVEIIMFIVVIVVIMLLCCFLNIFLFVKLIRIGKIIWIIIVLILERVSCRFLVV